jgi:alanyl-tRNA synthetase
MLSSKQIRSGFIDFFKSKGHTFIPSSPIVPAGDETLLFANAGMNQFKDIFTGLAAPEIGRAVNSQKCLRVSGKHNDLEEVGKDTYHHTFFEMLGNWSFDDYFKAEAIEWAWELLTKVWQIDANRLWVTVFAGDKEDGLPIDEEAKALWTKVTPISAERVLAFGRKDNFWEMGASGPCGPCSEIHIDLGPERCDKKDVPGHKCAVNAGCARFIELWNLVFIQYNRAEDGRLTPLKARYIDTGAGLERVAAVLQNKTGNYETDLFMPIIERVGKMAGKKYTSQLHNKTDIAFRVIADHIRSVSFAITDGAIPSNDGRGYVIRRILRRACRFGRELGLHEPFMHKLVPTVVEVMSEAFPETKERAEFVATVIESEETSFGRTLDRGIDIFNAAAKRAKAAGESVVSGADAFQLYDTYGFPLDLTQLMAQERGLGVDTAGFDELMAEQRERARAAQKSTSLTALVSDAELPITEDLQKYHVNSCDAAIIAFVEGDSLRKEGQIKTGDEVGIILDRTCFYAESGGQVGDCGAIEFNGARFVVEDTTKAANCVIHRGKVADGVFSVGDKVTATVSKDREAIKKNHTATHLLQWALQKVVGSSVAQQGSLVAPEYLRFDFTCPKALTPEQTAKVEELVRQRIDNDDPVTFVVMPREQAEKLGAMALFGEKYGSEVRVVAIGAADENTITEAFSREFCGGTHVDRLGVIGGFKIIKEESISAGVRRITALTGKGLEAYLSSRSDIADTLSEMLKVPAEQLPARVEQLVNENKRLAKELKGASKSRGADVMDQARQLLEKCERIGPTSVIIAPLETTSIEQARIAIDMLKKKTESAAIVFAFADGDKATLIAAVTDDLVTKGLKAGDIVKQTAPIIDGGGGGRPQMAQAGGKNPAKIPEALAKAEELIKAALAG